MVRTLKICLAALLAALLTFPALAWAASDVTATFDRPLNSKNVAYVYLHGLGNSHSVRVDLVAKDASGNPLSWNGVDSAATFQMASWLKEAASVAENTYTGNEMVVVISHGNNVLPTDASNTPDNYFIGTVTTSGDAPVSISIPEIQVTTGTNPETVTPAPGQDSIASVELNTTEPLDPDDPSNPLGNLGNQGASNTVLRPNNTTGGRVTGGDLARTGDEAPVLIGGLLAASVVAGGVIVAVRRRVRQ